MTLKDLQLGQTQDIEVYVAGIECAYSKYHDRYVKYHVIDEEGRDAKFVTFKEKEVAARKGDVGTFTVFTQDYRDGNLSYKAEKFVKSTNEKVRSAFFPKAKIQTSAGWHDLNGYYKQIGQPGLRKIVQVGLLKDREAIKTYPLASQGAFSRENGMLEATVRLVSIVTPIAKSFGLNVDLVISAGIVYYIGNLSMVTDGYELTTEDALFDPGLLAVRKMTICEQQLRQEGKLTDEELPKEISDAFYHCLASRQGGIRSAIPEAVLLRNADVMLRQLDDSLWTIYGLAQGQSAKSTSFQRYLKL